MNQNLLLLLAASVGLAADAGTWLATPKPTTKTQVISKTKLVVASANPIHNLVPTEIANRSRGTGDLSQGSREAPFVRGRSAMLQSHLLLASATQQQASGNRQEAPSHPDRRAKV